MVKEGEVWFSAISKSGKRATQILSNLEIESLPLNAHRWIREQLLDLLNADSDDEFRFIRREHGEQWERWHSNYGLNGKPIDKKT